MEKSKTFRNLFAIIKWECYNKQTCRVEIDSAVILVLNDRPLMLAILLGGCKYESKIAL